MKGKTLKAEYDAEHKTVKFLEPLEGFEDGDNLVVFVNKVELDHPLKAVSGILDDEAGESFARAVEEMFPIEK
ncbi:MAG TPA: hypothetical protein VJZ76_04430 [Thermoanaerobaculia bacterium]|nr:hypothetical protein [Thermoanaerobaculia bacterium]